MEFQNIRILERFSVKLYTLQIDPSGVVRGCLPSKLLLQHKPPLISQAWLSLQIVASGLVGDSSNFWIDAIFNATLKKWYWDSSGADVNLDFM